jgi:hypothetical protein
MSEGSIEAALREIVAARAALDSLERTLVVRARSHGSTWSDIAGPLGLSKQGARRRHLASDPVFAARSRRPPTIDEYHAEMVAALRAQGVFVE